MCDMSRHVKRPLSLLQSVQQNQTDHVSDAIVSLYLCKVCGPTPAPTPPPPGPGQPGHLVWQSLEYGAGTSGHGIDNEAPIAYNGSIYFMSALNDWTVYVALPPSTSFDFGRIVAWP